MEDCFILLKGYGGGVKKCGEKNSLEITFEI